MKNHLNIITATDSYKVTHWQQYPENTTGIFSFFESRGGEFDTVTFFGLQYLIMEYLAGQVVTEEDIDEAKELFTGHLGSEDLFNEAGWRYIVEQHGGRLPVRICAVPEGSRIPTKNVLITVENTDPKVPWIVNYLETLLSQIWYPSTVCTISNDMRQTILEYLESTGDTSLVDFKMHDFGFRGVSSVETAGIGGAAHLVNFQGTDTLAAIRLAKKYYQEPLAGFSIPAAEHSTITSWGRENEVEAFRNMLTSFPTGLVAVVSDSYDIYHACRELWGKELKDEVLKRDGTLVVRPDSGYPPEIVVKVLDLLGEAFGYETNDKGYKVLDPHVRVIQGDGIDNAMVRTVLEAMEAAGWSADNIAFGSGGGLLQKMNRDTQKFAFKCCAIQTEGAATWNDVYKDPVTDAGKRSKRGRLALVKKNGEYQTIREEELGTRENLLVPIFENGKLLVEHTFADIRARAQK